MSTLIAVEQATKLFSSHVLQQREYRSVRARVHLIASEERVHEAEIDTDCTRKVQCNRAVLLATSSTNTNYLQTKHEKIIY